IETPHSYILIDGRNKKVTLYMPPRNERLERSEGRVLNADDEKLIKKLVGVDQVRSTDEMRMNFPPDLKRSTIIYTMFTPAEGQGQSRYELEVANASIAADPWDGRISREGRFVQLLRTHNRNNNVKDLTPIIDDLRSVKSNNEIALIRRASQLAGLGMIEAVKSTEVGAWEYQLDGVARYVYLINGARLEAYRSITASGTKNISNGHYYRNDSQLKSGDMVLMDYAPDFRYYVSDIGRMWPVNGKYEPWQRELLQIILEYRNVVLDIIRPGITTDQILEEARKKMKPIMKNHKFSKKIYKKAAEKMVRTGGGVLSHPVGLAVHDDGPYRNGPLKVGHVFSVDPQLWVPEENLYLRYEDTIVVTKNGNENFTDFLPSELDDLESLVLEKGILQTLPENKMKWRR
ncbi:MAG: M24 family metallopeptidase, partial [Candidatus Marinimicrobia bacterium]|nr:M24 family metallopeptidase [Candidatus Neomarinimicrobiota bacterium]